MVWVLRPDDEDFASREEQDTLQCERYMVFAPRHVIERVTAQVAWFTVHRCSEKQPGLEPLEHSHDFKAKLTEVTIPGGRFAHLRFHLNRYGVNHASVFPGLDGLCAHIKWKRCFLPDEAPKG